MTAAFTAISQGWGWKERDVSIASVLDEVGSLWTDAAAFPSEVHVELLKAGRIPDPFKGSNEHEVQCESCIAVSSCVDYMRHLQGSANVSGCTAPSSMCRSRSAAGRTRSWCSRGWIRSATFTS